MSDDLAQSTSITLEPKPSQLFLESLRKIERGQLAVLKRNAGHTIAESRAAIGLFYRLLPKGIAGGRDEEIYFLIATLFGLNTETHNGDFGSTMQAVKILRSGPAGDFDSGLDHRMAVLLDSQFDSVDGRRPGGGELAYRLRQCVKLAAGARVGVDWEQLLEDLIWWTHPDRRVHKRWARSYYGSAREHEKKKEESTDAR